MTIDIEKELADANARLPVAIPDNNAPMELQMRSIALTVAARFVADTAVQDGALYQQLKMDNKLGGFVTVETALRAALVFERYLWGEFSSGLVENALAATSKKVATAIEAEIEKRMNVEFGSDGEPPIRSHDGNDMA